jgi:hypothetical protein
MEGDLDTFDFVLALDLGRTLAELSAMSMREWLAWRAYYTYRAAMSQMEARR